MQPKKLPYKTFLKTFEHVPRVAISLVIINKSKQILLTKRAKSPFKNYWHLPGSFILKGETQQECMIRIAKQELGVSISGSQKLITISDNIHDDPRGHVVDIIYRVEVNDVIKDSFADSRDIQFFDTLPAKIGFNHRYVIKHLTFDA